MRETHSNIPDRLSHLFDLPFAHFVGVSPGGVDWVAYRPENIEPMQRGLRVAILKAALKQRAKSAPWV